MSVHRSLVSSSGLRRGRNVLSRAERIFKLKENDSWQEGDSIFGLPKVKGETIIKKSKGKKKKKDEEE